MRGRGDQVGNVAGCLASALQDDRLHGFGVARKDFHRNTRHDLLIAAQQFHLPAFDQRIVIFTNVADGIALERLVSMPPLALGRVILCFRKCRYDLSVLPDRIPSAVVEMQMAVDYDVDLFRRNSRSGQVLQQLRRLTVNHLHFFRELVVDSGFDQDCLLARLHHNGIESNRHEIILVRLDLLAPHTFRNDSEEGATIETVEAVGDSGKLEITKVHPSHRQGSSSCTFVSLVVEDLVTTKGTKVHKGKSYRSSLSK